MTGQQAERRQDARVIFRTTAKLSFEDGRNFDKCETRDIGVSGVFVKSVKGIGTGENCRVYLHLTGSTSNLILEMAGEIVRIEDDGVAVQLFDVDDDSFFHLRNIVYLNYKDSGSAEEVKADIEDESLYSDLDTGKKGARLPDDYLDEINDIHDSDDDGDEDISKHVKRYQDDEEY